MLQAYGFKIKKRLLFILFAEIVAQLVLKINVKIDIILRPDICR